MNTPHPEGGVHRLGKRQLECIELAARGMLNKEIAYELGIEEASVKGLFSDALRKTGARTRAQLISWWMRSETIKFDTILKSLASLERKIDLCLALSRISVREGVTVAPLAAEQDPQQQP
jgi:DNA-binding CsgD family transcriptional regulator